MVSDFNVFPEDTMRGQTYQVAVLYNLENGVPKGDPHDLLALQYTANTTQKIYEALSSL